MWASVSPYKVTDERAGMQIVGLFQVTKTPPSTMWAKERLAPAQLSVPCHVRTFSCTSWLTAWSGKHWAEHCHGPLLLGQIPTRPGPPYAGWRHKLSTATAHPPGYLPVLADYRHAQRRDKLIASIIICLNLRWACQLLHFSITLMATFADWEAIEFSHFILATTDANVTCNSKPRS